MYAQQGSEPIDGQVPGNNGHGAVHGDQQHEDDEVIEGEFREA